MGLFPIADASQGAWLYKVEPSGGRLLGTNKVTHAMWPSSPNSKETPDCSSSYKCTPLWRSRRYTKLLRVLRT